MQQQRQQQQKLQQRRAPDMQTASEAHAAQTAMHTAAVTKQRQLQSMIAAHRCWAVGLDLLRKEAGGRSYIAQSDDCSM